MGLLFLLQGDINMADLMGKGLTHDGNNKKTGRPEFLVNDKNNGTIVSELLGDSPTGKLWSYLWEIKDAYALTLKDLSECAGISRTSLYRIMPIFIKYEWVIPAKIEKNVQYYKLNKNHYIARQMLKLITDHVLAATEIILAEEEAMDKVALRFKKKEKIHGTKKIKRIGKVHKATE